MRYQVYFRFSRGGVGIPYDLTKTEFLSVFNDAIVMKERTGKHRMWAELSLNPNEVPRSARRLGYTEAILLLHAEPYRGETIHPTRRGRWHIGWCREGKWKVHQTEVYVQDAESLLEMAPNNRSFEVLEGGGKRRTYRRRSHRAMSALDVRFLLNVANPKSTDVILDPFAGYGGIATEAIRRGLTVFVSDIDQSLSPGLESLGSEAYWVADARSLPMCNDCIDLVITEPPFRPPYREIFLDSLSELQRVLKPGGELLTLIKVDMSEAVRLKSQEMGSAVDLIGVIPRGGGMKCSVLKIVPE